MTLELDTTVAGTTSNSYIELSDAAAYFEAKKEYTNIWAGYSDDEKIGKIIEATRAIDRLTYKGRKYKDHLYGDQEQALQFPRFEDLDHTIIPIQVKNATCEMIIAMDLIQTGTYGSADEENVERVSVGGVSVELRSSKPLLAGLKAKLAGGSIEAVTALLDKWIVGELGAIELFDWEW